MPIPQINSFENLRQRNIKGFTFIEMLLVIAIMALLFGVGFSNFRGFQERQRLTSAVRIFRADLRYTQSQALAGIKPPGCGSLDAYRLAWVSPTTYEIGALCDRNATAIVTKSGNFENGFPGISFNAAFTPVIFNVLGRGVRNAVNITLKDDSSPPQTVSIQINTGGEIN